MKKYTKGVLTVIAICLVSIAFKDTPIVEKAFADVKGYMVVASTQSDTWGIMGKNSQFKICYPLAGMMGIDKAKCTEWTE